MKSKLIKALRPYIKRLFLTLLLLVCAGGLAITRSYLIASLADQNAWKRWGSDNGRFGQVSVYFTDALAVTPDNIKEYEYNLEKAMTENSINVQNAENGSLAGTGGSAEAASTGAADSTLENSTDTAGSSASADAFDSSMAGSSASADAFDSSMAGSSASADALDSSAAESSVAADSAAQVSADAADSSSAEENAAAQTYIDCYSANGTVAVKHGKKEVTVNAEGVGGDFFYFHPVKIITGAYFLDENEMKDQIVIDEDLAWTLFGSNDVVGQSVTIGGVPHYISAVVERESGRLAKASGLGNTLIYLSYQSLALYGTINTSSGASNTKADANSTTGTSSAKSTVTTGSVTSGSSTQSRADTDAPKAARPAASGEGRHETFLSSAAENDGMLIASATGTDTTDTTDTTGSADTTGSTDATGAANTTDTTSGTSSATGTSVSASDTSDTSAESTISSGTASSSSQGTGTGSGTDTGTASGTDTASGTGTGTASSGTGTGTADSIETTELVISSLGDAQTSEVESTDASGVPGISCYEIIMPNPVDNFASSLIKSKLGPDEKQMTIIDNTRRFTGTYLLRVALSFPTRSMQLTSYCYPYWENIARGYEDILAVVFAAECILLIFAFLLICWMIIDWYRNRTWRTEDIVKFIGDKYYDYSSRHRKDADGKHRTKERQSFVKRIGSKLFRR